MHPAVRCLFAAALFAPGLAAATVYTVGPAGTHATIQAAIDAAIAHAGSDEVRVHTGVYNESLWVSASMNTSTLTLSGGWADGYAVRAAGGAVDTLVAPGPEQSGALFSPAGGQLNVSHFNFYGASTTFGGAGVRIEPTGGSVSLHDSLLVENAIQTTASASGAGVRVLAGGTTAVTLTANLFQRNRITITSGPAAVLGAALVLQCHSGATCALIGNRFEDTVAEPANGQAMGATMYVKLSDFATGQIENNIVSGTVLGPGTTSHVGRSMYVYVENSAAAYVRSNQIRSTVPLVGTGYGEVAFSLHGTSNTTIAGNVVGNSPTSAFDVTLTESASATLTNLTAANDAYGFVVTLAPPAQATVNNCLTTSDSLHNVLTGTTGGNNLLGFAQPFLAPSLFDFGFRKGTAAPADAGNDAAPGLPTTDVTGAARVQGPHVDIGAYEFSDRIFADRFDN